MKRIFYEGKDNFYFQNIEKRKCKAKEVEIEVKVMGLCGSDIHKFLKQSPDKNYLSTNILGHEIVGIVTNLGNKCTKVNIGNHVVINPFCIPKKFNKCESFSLVDNALEIVGRTIDGGYSELIYVPENCVYKLPNNIENEEAIFIDDIAVSLHGIHYIEKYCSSTNKIAVIGDGPLGILCYRILCNKYDKSEIILFSKNQNKISNLNINYVSFSEIDKYENEFDIILEVVGGNQSDTLNKAIKIGNNNCVILCYGVFQFNYMASLNIRSLFYKQGLLKGINSYCNMYDDFNNAITILNDKKIQVKDLITKKIDFNDSVEYIKNYEKTSNNIKTIFEVK